MKLNRTIFNTPIINSVMRFIAKVLLFSSGWRSEGSAPNASKFVLIAAPHTSNWDLFYTIIIAFDMKIPIYWMGKDAIFKKPFGGLMKWLGGIPINRSQSHNVVEQAVEQFNSKESLTLTVPPSGTRSRIIYWKTGFYYIALGANVPIVLGYLDYRRKRGGLGPLVHPTGYLEGDMEAITKFYSNITGKYPSKMSMARVYVQAEKEAA